MLSTRKVICLILNFYEKQFFLLHFEFVNPQLLKGNDSSLVQNALFRNEYRRLTVLHKTYVLSSIDHQSFLNNLCS